ncbi:hypothetical protein JCM11251_005069 [Rhodosporidiobolus azoricus]
MPSTLPYVVCSGLLVLLNLIPLYWQFGQGNSGPIAMGVWVVLMNANEFINAVVWYGDVVNRAPVWCDITVKIGLGGQVGRLAAVFCIARFLADVVSPRATAMTRQDRRRRAFFDYTVSFGVPVIIMACHIVYQANRFALIRGVGCTATQLMSWPTLVLRLIWGPIFAVGGVFYSAYTVYRLIRHRRNFGRIVAGAHSALTTSRFVRLAVLSMSYLCIGVPLSLFSVIQNIATSGRYLDYSWQYFRSTWHHEPILIDDKQTLPDLSAWSNVIVGFIFFAAFGFGSEALQLYTKVMKSCFGYRFASKGSFSSRKSWRPTLFSRIARSPGEQPHTDRAIRIFTRDVALRPPLSDGVKVVVEKEEDIV